MCDHVGGDHADYPWLQFVPNSGATEVDLVHSYLQQFGQDIEHVDDYLEPMEIQLIAQACEIRGKRMTIPPEMWFTADVFPSLNAAQLALLQSRRPTNVFEMYLLLVNVPEECLIDAETGECNSSLRQILTKEQALELQDNKATIKTLYDVCKLLKVDSLGDLAAVKSGDASPSTRTRSSSTSGKNNNSSPSKSEKSRDNNAPAVAMDLKPFVMKLLATNGRLNHPQQADNVAVGVGGGVGGGKSCVQLEFERLTKCVLEVYFHILHNYKKPASAGGGREHEAVSSSSSSSALPALQTPATVSRSQKRSGSGSESLGSDGDSQFLERGFIDGEDGDYEGESGSFLDSAPGDRASTPTTTGTGSLSGSGHRSSISSEASTQVPGDLTAYTYSRKRRTWAEAAGRKEGGSGYQMGDLTKSVVRKITGSGKSSRASFNSPGLAGGMVDEDNASTSIKQSPRLTESEVLKLCKIKVIGTEVREAR
jgi:hypothetical protein